MSDLRLVPNALASAAPVQEIKPARRPWWLFCACLLLAGYALMMVVPSFQAPDEFDHVRRAFQLSDGSFLLRSVDGSPSGGYEDPALETYMIGFSALPHHPEVRMDGTARIALESQHWGQQPRVFQAIPSTANYFPAVYLPQAAGMAAGRAMNLPVGQTYRLARWCALLAAIALLMVACSVHAPPPLAAGILALPMSLFLLSSAAPDGVLMAIAMLGLSAFARLAVERDAAPRHLAALLLICVFLLVTSSPGLLPMFVFPFAVALGSRFHWQRTAMVTVVMLLAIAWIGFVLRTTVYSPDPDQPDHLSRLTFFLMHPWAFLHGLRETVLASGHVQFYAMSFLGVFGWLDTFLPAYAYRALLLLLIMLTACSFVAPANRACLVARWLLVGCAALSTLLTFLAPPGHWLQAGTDVAADIQGRYFLVPALMVAYALSLGSTSVRPIRPRFSLLFLVLLLAVSTSVTTYSLVSRFHLAPDSSHGLSDGRP
ncbi:MAG TPA: DUF2142 domain-containing protein [Rhodanobacter sp.]|nr:DUF2142 domain-containing protein [Rhodanobacter sp.]